jgi:hypothetical protein
VRIYENAHRLAQRPLRRAPKTKSNLIGDVENDAPAEQQVNGEMDTKIKLQLQPKLLSLKKHKAPTPATRFSGSPGASAIHHH